jgi:hypothetical protein
MMLSECTWGNWRQLSWVMIPFFPHPTCTHTETHTYKYTHVFSFIKISLLFCTSSLWCKWPWRWILTNSQCCQVMFVTSWTNGVLLRFICKICFKKMNNSLHYKGLILPQKVLLLWRKHIKRAICVHTHTHARMHAHTHTHTDIYYSHGKGTF